MPSNAKQEIQPLLNVHEVARRLGISERYIYQLVAAGKLPHLRIGRLLRFDAGDVLGWVRDGGLGRPAKKSS